jgi:hypothetical protein
LRERGAVSGSAIRWGLLLVIVVVGLAVLLDNLLSRQNTLEQGAEGKSPRPPLVGQQLVETLIWMNVYSPSSLLDEEPLPPGTVVEAYDPQGALCGRFVVARVGKYGLMPLYGDDPSSPLDEGALPGDTITFWVNGSRATSTPARVHWTTYGDVQRVDLYASSPANQRGIRDWLATTLTQIGRSLRDFFIP